ncbi:MAG: DNA repair exonuclease [Betaproteobacteria bacterium]|nr:DNA repair exonuclease [Betaproteobacteria bacterium]
MRFIHAADLHLDSPLRGLSAYPDAPADRLRTTTRDAFRNLVDHAIAEAVDFMVIAGDVYDGDWKDFNTGLFFVRQMGRLRHKGIPVFLLHGNHDAESEMTRGLELPDNVRVFPSRRAETFRIEALRVALHGRSFRVAATTENLLPGYPPPVPGWLNIGVLHTALEGHAEHARYAPCSLAELRARGYQYWALGHVHEHWLERGPVTIAYPGNLQGRHIREPGVRGALMVSAEGDEITAVERIESDVLRWHLLGVDISACGDRSAAIRAAGQGLAQALAATPSHLPLAVRVVFTGRSPAHAALLADEVQLRHEVISQALALAPERVWIEKVRVLAEPAGAASTPFEDEREGALAELAGLALTAVNDPGFRQALESDWRAVLDKLPHEVLQVSPELQSLRQDPAAQTADRLHEATALLLARMTLGSGTAE